MARIRRIPAQDLGERFDPFANNFGEAAQGGSAKILREHKIRTKFFYAEFVVSNVPNDTRTRFLFPEELAAHIKHKRESLPKKARYINPLRKALKYQSILGKNPDLNKSRLAKQLGVSRVRITQVLGLLRLPSAIRQKILQTRGLTEHSLRPLIQIQNQEALEMEFSQILAQNMS